MLVLEATSQRQGERPGDYHWCVDRELAYSRGTACSRADCGCERGWAGVDSHRATTTVQVVDRPGFTVNDLASEVAQSLFEAGWITELDTNHAMVAEFVDQIVDMANHFGEGAVLERDGQWVRMRDAAAETIEPFDRLSLESLTKEIDGGSPMDLLAHATSVLASAGPLASTFIATLHDAGWPKAQMLGCALEWLSEHGLARAWNDIPEWLAHLDQLTVVGAHRACGDDGHGYLVELNLYGYEAGLISVFVTSAGPIGAFFGVADPLPVFIELLKTVRQHNFRPYREVKLSTARRALVTGRARGDTNAAPPVPGAWPANLPLLDFVLDVADWEQGGPNVRN